MLAVGGAKTDAESLFHPTTQRGERGQAGTLFEPRQGLASIGGEEKGGIGWPRQRPDGYMCHLS